MSLIGWLIGEKGIESQKQQANKIAQAEFNPAIYGSALGAAETRASMGLPLDQMRSQILRNLYSSVPTGYAASVGGNQAAYLAGQEQMGQNIGANLASQEAGLQMKNVQYKTQQQQQATDVLTQMQQVNAQREAAIRQNELTAQSEIQRRKGKLLSSVLKFAVGAGTAALTGGLGLPVGTSLPGAAGLGIDKLLGFAPQVSNAGSAGLTAEEAVNTSNSLIKKLLNVPTPTLNVANTTNAMSAYANENLTAAAGKTSLPDNWQLSQYTQNQPQASLTSPSIQLLLHLLSTQ